MNAIRVMCLLCMLFVSTRAAGEEEPAPTFAIGRVQRLGDGTTVLRMRNGVRVILHGYRIPPGFVVVGAAGVLTPVEGEAKTYAMQVKNVDFMLTKERFQGLEEVHAAMIDAAIKSFADGTSPRIALEQAAVVIRQYAGNHCDDIARCRAEQELAARVVAGTVDLRTLPAVLKSYRDDPLSLRP